MDVCGNLDCVGGIGKRLGLFWQPNLQRGTTVMQFTRIVGSLEDMQVWNASSNAASFVISYESQLAVPAFAGNRLCGVLASSQSEQVRRKPCRVALCDTG